MDQKTRKLMTMHKALHPRDDTDRLYVSRNGGGRGLVCIQDSIDASIQWLKDYRNKHQKQYRKHKDQRNRNNKKNKSGKGNNSGHFMRQKNKTPYEKDMAKKENLRKETESLLIAAQKNAIRTNYFKGRIDKTQQHSKCWVCGDRDEIISHIMSKYSILVQREYKIRHYWVEKVVHWRLCNKFKLSLAYKCICTTRNPSSITRHKILWDFLILTDHLMSARRPDLVIVNKKQRTSRIVGFAVAEDDRVKLKEDEKRYNK